MKFVNDNVECVMISLYLEEGELKTTEEETISYVESQFQDSNITVGACIDDCIANNKVLLTTDKNQDNMNIAELMEMIELFDIVESKFPQHKPMFCVYFVSGAEEYFDKSEFLNKITVIHNI